MKLNRLGFLSLLSLLGILGLFVDNSGLLGFFGFLYYLRYFFVIPDELFQENVRKATSIGFFTGVAATGLVFALRVVLPVSIAPSVALATTFIVSVACFTIALVVFEIREQRGI